VSRRFGLLGGTFDPVHRAHLALAQVALASCALEGLLWIPAGRPWQKGPGVTAAEHRLAMLRLAIEGEPRYGVDPRELERPGPSYTIDTVRELACEQAGIEWVLVIGQDQHAALHTWHHWHELLQRVTLAVARRPGAATAVDPAVRAHGHIELPLPPLDIAASALRRRVAEGQDISRLVPATVASYIDSHGLYRAPLPTPPRS
jgi:nicotinate-nucleotide adenylyltransferase